MQVALRPLAVAANKSKPINTYCYGNFCILEQIPTKATKTNLGGNNGSLPQSTALNSEEGQSVHFLILFFLHSFFLLRHFDTWSYIKMDSSRVPLRDCVFVAAHTDLFFKGTLLSYALFQYTVSVIEALVKILYRYFLCIFLSNIHSAHRNPYLRCQFYISRQIVQQVWG